MSSSPPCSMNSASSSASEGGDSESGDSEIADFVTAFGSDSEDGELPLHRPAVATSCRKPAAQTAAAVSTPAAALEALQPEPEVPAAGLSQLDVGSGSIAESTVAGLGTTASVAAWEALCASFRRSDPPGQVATAFSSLPGWQLTDVQEAVWHLLLSERVASGPGSREYVTRVLKAVVDVCDRARQEVAEILLDNLIALQTSFADSKTVEESAVLAAVEADAAEIEPQMPAGSDESSKNAGASCSDSWSRFNCAMLADKPLTMLQASCDHLTGKVLPRLLVAPTPPVPPSAAALAAGMNVLRHRYPLTELQREQFRRDKFIRLKDVIPAPVLAAARDELISIVVPATGGVNVSDPDVATRAELARRQRAAAQAGCPAIVEGAAAEQLWSAVSGENVKPWHVQMAWTLRPVVNAVVLAPRIGAIVSDLLGVSGVRLYHDNTLSRCPGSQRTKWHCDDGPDKHMAMATPNVVTVWVPLQTTPPEMGSLAFAAPPPRGHDAWSIRKLDGCPGDEKSDEYDRFVAASLEAKGVKPDQGTYALGDISIHLTSVYHCAGPNLTTATRMIIGSTYFEDGATMRDDVPLEGRRAHDFQTFVPDTSPGEAIATKLNPLLDQPAVG